LETKVDDLALVLTSSVSSSNDDQFIYIDTGATKHVVQSITNIPPAETLQIFSGEKSTITGVDGNNKNNLIVSSKVFHPYLGEFLVVPTSGFNLINPHQFLDNYDCHMPSNKSDSLVITYKVPPNWTINAVNFPKDAVVLSAKPHQNLYRVPLKVFTKAFVTDPISKHTNNPPGVRNICYAYIGYQRIQRILCFHRKFVRTFISCPGVN
jgi:hypothetical protein